MSVIEWVWAGGEDPNHVDSTLAKTCRFTSQAGLCGESRVQQVLAEVKKGSGLGWMEVAKAGVQNDWQKSFHFVKPEGTDGHSPSTSSSSWLSDV
jgi:hypothetical protein